MWLIRDRRERKAAKVAKETARPVETEGDSAVLDLWRDRCNDLKYINNGLFAALSQEKNEREILSARLEEARLGQSKAVENEKRYWHAELKLALEKEITRGEAMLEKERTRGEAALEKERARNDQATIMRMQGFKDGFAAHHEGVTLHRRQKATSD